MKVTEEMVTLLLKKRYEKLYTEIAFSLSPDSLSEAERFVNAVGSIVDDMKSIIANFRQEQAEKCDEV